jgi:ABC-type antimicrobial peptide transport system permease subunit
MAGIGAGLLGSLGVGRLLTNLLFGVSPTDPLTFAGVPLVLGAMALVASYIPAFRATKVDPMKALRQD